MLPLRLSARLRALTLLLIALAGRMGNASAQSQDSPVSAGPVPSDLVVRSWTLSAGLPDTTVNAITQTRDGFLWVGTNGGLGRFDGVGYRNYGLLDGLRSIWVLALAEDREGTLWIGTVGGGLSRWENGVLTTCAPEEGFPEGSDILALAADPDGSLWIGTEKGLLQRTGGKITPVGEAQGLPQGQVRRVLVDSRGVLWVSVLTQGLYRASGGKFVKVEEPAGGEAPGGRVYSLTEVPGGAILAGSNSRIWRQSEGAWEKRDESDGVPDTDINALVCSAGGVTWAGARGAGLYREYGGQFEKVVTRSALDANSVLSLFEDRQGLLWAGTAGAGLFRLAPRIMQLQGQETGLPASVLSLAEDASGNIWAATSDRGVYRWQEGKFLQITSETDPEVSGNYPYIYCIATAADESIWAAGESCVYRFQPGHATKRFSDPPVSGEAIRALAAGGEVMWMGTYYGTLLKGDAAGVQVAAPARTFPGGITSLAVEAEDVLWVGTSRGVHRWEKEKLQTWDTRDGLLTAHILALHRDADGTVWLGTLGGGLARMRDGKFVHFTTRQGLIEDTISQILADDYGCIWLAADRGLMRLERRELEAVAAGKAAELHPVFFGRHEGLPVEKCAGGTSPNAIKTKAGRLLFLAGGGIAGIDPGRLQESRPVAAPQSSLVDVVLDRERRPLNEPLVIPPGNHRLEISYTAPVLQGGDWVRFRYKLEGLDKDWLPAVRDRKVSYDNLSPGRYVFHVTASDGSGNSGSPATLAFTVQPYYWQTAWFRLLAVTGAAALVAGLATIQRSGRRRRRAERRAYERELQTAREELAHLTRVAMLGELSGSLAHELNQPLAAVLSNAQAGIRFLVQGKPDLQEMQALLQDIAEDAKRAGGVIHGMRAMFKKDTRQEPHPVDVNEVVHQVLALLHSEYVARRAEVEFYPGNELPQVLAGKVELMQVLINLVLNSLDAMKDLSGPRRVVVVSARAGDLISVCVHDCGPGIAPEVAKRLFSPFVTTKAGGLGLGLAISRNIVERFGGRLTAENHPQGGAKFCVHLPAAALAKPPLQPRTPPAD